MALPRITYASLNKVLPRVLNCTLTTVSQNCFEGEYVSVWVHLHVGFFSINTANVFSVSDEFLNNILFSSLRYYKNTV